MNNIFINIDYDDENQSSYNGIIASYKDEKVVFNTNDPTIDYIDMLKWAAEKNFEFITFSSSVDHFMMDGNDNKFISDFSELSIKEIKRLSKYIANKDINSFDDHLNYYRSKKL